MTTSTSTEALADLRESGLSDETILAANLHTPAPGDLPRLLGPRLATKAAHALVLPYLGAESFYRAELFPPGPDGQGHTIRYCQLAGTPPRRYLPPGLADALSDPSIALHVTEGEKKALKATQEGACPASGSAASGTGATRADRSPTSIVPGAAPRDQLLVCRTRFWRRTG